MAIPTELHATLQMYRDTLLDVASTIEASPRDTITPTTLEPDSAGQRAIEQLAGYSRGGLALQGTLGEGGMGIVHLALQASVGRNVAVKRLRDGNTRPAAVVKLLREAWVTGALEHPNVLPLYDVRLDDIGMPWVVLKKISGVEWAALLVDDKQLSERFDTDDPFDQHLQIFLQVCHAVAFAHSRGIVHRDLKPENVMIGEFGEVLLIDWGLAVSVRDDGSGRMPLARDATELAGTPGYMAPEMLGGDMPRVDERTDIYLLGSILYEIACRRAPHEGESFVAIVTKVLASEPVFAPDVPEELVAIIRRCMRPAAADRYQSVEELRSAVQHFIRHRGSMALTSHVQQRLRALQEHLAGDGDRTEAYNLFGACRFGFREALASWSGNGLAREGLTTAITTMVELELAQNEPRAAATLLSELDDAPAELHARVEHALVTHAADQARVAKLAQVGAEHDVAVGARTRSGVFLMMATVWIGLPLVWWQFFPEVEPTHWLGGMLPLALIVLGTPLVIWARDSLSKTATNRRFVAATFLVLLGQAVLSLGCWLTGIEASHTATLYFFLWFFGAAMVTATLEIKLFPAAVGYAAGYFAAIRWPELRPFIVATVHAVAALTLVAVWGPETGWLSRRKDDGPTDH